MIETFVASELRSDAAVESTRPQTFHLRTDGGRQEIDLVLEYAGGTGFAVEIKASAVPGRRDARHLTWRRDEIGDRFLGSVVFHAGPDIIGLSDKILAVPICALWAETP